MKWLKENPLPSVVEIAQGSSRSRQEAKTHRKPDLKGKGPSPPLEEPNISHDVSGANPVGALCNASGYTFMKFANTCAKKTPVQVSKHGVVVPGIGTSNFFEVLSVPKEESLQ